MNKLSVGAAALGLSISAVVTGAAQAAEPAQCVAAGAGWACPGPAGAPSTNVADARTGQSPVATAPAAYYPNYGRPKHPGGR
jgi:hypothetical protein